MGGRDRGVRRPAGRRTAATGRSTRSSAGGASAFARVATGRAVAPLARRRPTRRAELAAYVLWSATVRPAGLRRPRGGADVQALDGQGVELGPLLQRARARRGGRRTRRSTSSCCRSTTRTRRARCRTRSPTPRCSTTSSSRRSTAGRSAQLRRAHRRPVRRATSWPTVYQRLARWTALLARLPPRARARAAVLPARQRQRLGQRHDVRRGPRGRVAGPRRVPDPAAATSSPAWPTGSGEPAAGVDAEAARIRSARCSTSSGPATASSPARSTRRTCEQRTSLLNADADRARRRPARRASPTASPPIVEAT